jgi:orotidine-5'-phosphate decarboxylase
MTFSEKLERAAGQNDSLLCVGLDPDLPKLPQSVRAHDEPLYDFNRAIIDAAADLVCAFKPNSAFYEAAGASGIAQLKKTCDYVREQYPHLPIILDFKRGDIGNTSSSYAAFAFEYLGVDAVTIHPYMGREANEAFLAYRDKGIIVLCRTSNPGAGEFQDLLFGGKKLYQIVAQRVLSDWNGHGNCHLVMGAPYPEELAWARQTAGDDIWFLVPGAGSQGGDMGAAVAAGQNSRGSGLIVNASREVLYASSGDDFPKAARSKAIRLRDTINKHRRSGNGRS